MNQKIKFIYFDVGGVLILDFSNTNKWQQLKNDLGVNEAIDPEFEAIWQKYRNRICLDLDVDSLLPEIQSKTKLKLPPNYSLLNDFVNRFQANPSIWPVLKIARDKYQIGLLTNMYPRMLKAIEEVSLIPKFNWDVVIDSSQVAKQKPDPEIFELALEKSGVKKEEILFIDNLEKNTSVAQKMGWQVFCYDDQNPEKASRELKDLLQ